uniref:Uncharacterized protein n=1 Tax=Arundo donax TaxID=35708 RepID=A0A0A9C5L6_ARUDO
MNCFSILTHKLTRGARPLPFPMLLPAAESSCSFCHAKLSRRVSPFPSLLPLPPALATSSFCHDWATDSAELWQ